MRRATVWTWLAALSLMGAVPRDAAGQPAPTYAGDIAPLLWKRCGECHHPGGPAPFSLVSYDDARQRARQIATATRSRYMPPWKPEPGAGEFIGSRRLSDLEIALIGRWADAGAPEGNRSALPVPPVWSGGWRIGTPDLVLALPDYVVPPSNGTDVYRNFAVDVPFAGSRFVRGIEFLPGNPSVHHANVFVDRTPTSRTLDAEDPAPGYQGLIPHSAEFPDGYFLGWTPGQAAPLDPPDMSWPLDGGSSLLVQLHLQSTGKPERIQPLIGLYFAEGEPAERQRPVMLRLGRQNLDIAPGDARYVVVDEFELPIHAEVRAVQPHAHYRAKTVRAVATLPDGRSVPLLSIARWDFNWQDRYQYVTPVSLPAGTRLTLEYVFDNSAGNPRNPASPPKRVGWGFRSGDEMADLWIQLTARSAEDRERLRRSADRKMTAESIVGYESQIRENPNYGATRNDVALLYMETDRPDLALPHFARVTELDPGSPAAHFNLATALEATGQEARAVDEYESALRLNPAYTRARDGLASIYYKRAYVLDRQQRSVEAIAALRRALTIRIDWPDALGQLTWLLATTGTAADAAEAVALGQRGADLTGNRDAGVLDSLAAAYAAAGRMADAIRTAEAAEALARVSSPDLGEQIRSRLALYRAGQSVRSRQ